MSVRDDRATGLSARLADARGRRVAFVSHCLLNQNVRYLWGGVRYWRIARRVAAEIADYVRSGFEVVGVVGGATRRVRSILGACYTRGVKHRFSLWLGCSLALSAVALGAASCGARTDLGGHVVSADATAEDQHADHHADADADVVEEDVIEDIVFPDVPIVTNCADAGTQYIYVITEQNELFSFFPPTLGFTKIGDISCTNASTPFSMGVDRSGIAYSVFQNGELFEISTLNAACKSTTYKPNQFGISVFGMGYSGAADAGETLYIAESTNQNPRLGWIDTQTFKLNVIGNFSPQGGGRCELTGTGDGHLYAFCLPQQGSGGDLVNLDPTNANIISEVKVGVGTSQDAFAYAFYGGLFYIFTGPSNQPTTVTEFDPIKLTTKAVATLPSTIVGAGVSTCAPQK